MSENNKPVSAAQPVSDGPPDVRPQEAGKAPACGCPTRKALTRWLEVYPGWARVSGLIADDVRAALSAPCPCAGLREAVGWAYQAVGALWPNCEALDNLSAVLAGEPVPHEWPVVPPDRWPEKEGK